MPKEKDSETLRDLNFLLLKLLLTSSKGLELSTFGYIIIFLLKVFLKSAFLSKNPVSYVLETNKISVLWSLFGDKASG